MHLLSEHQNAKLPMLRQKGAVLWGKSPNVILALRSAESTRALLPIFELRCDEALFHFTSADFSLKELMLVVEILNIKAIYHVRNTHTFLLNLPRFIWGCWFCRRVFLLFIYLLQHQKVIQVFKKDLPRFNLGCGVHLGAGDAMGGLAWSGSTIGGQTSG